MKTKMLRAAIAASSGAIVHIEDLAISRGEVALAGVTVAGRDVLAAMSGAHIDVSVSGTTMMIGSLTIAGERSPSMAAKRVPPWVPLRTRRVTAGELARVLDIACPVAKAAPSKTFAIRSIIITPSSAIATDGNRLVIVERPLRNDTLADIAIPVGVADFIRVAASSSPKLATVELFHDGAWGADWSAHWPAIDTSYLPPWRASAELQFSHLATCSAPMLMEKCRAAHRALATPKNPAVMDISINVSDGEFVISGKSGDLQFLSTIYACDTSVARNFSVNPRFMADALAGVAGMVAIGATSDGVIIELRAANRRTILATIQILDDPEKTSSSIAGA